MNWERYEYELRGHTYHWWQACLVWFCSLLFCLTIWGIFGYAAWYLTKS